MPRIAYIDESVRKNYIMAAVIVDAAAGARARQDLRRAARDMNRSSLHFKDLLPRQRREALVMFDKLDIVSSCIVIHARQKGQTDMDSRDLILKELVEQLQRARVGEMILDHMVNRQPKDGEVIRRARQGGPTISYRHVYNKDEPLLWLADGVAHTYGRGEHSMPGWHTDTIKL